MEKVPSLPLAVVIGLISCLLIVGCANESSRKEPLVWEFLSALNAGDYEKARELMDPDSLAQWEAQHPGLLRNLIRSRHLFNNQHLSQLQSQGMRIDAIDSTVLDSYNELHGAKLKLVRVRKETENGISENPSLLIAISKSSARVSIFLFPMDSQIVTDLIYEMETRETLEKLGTSSGRIMQETVRDPAQ